MRFLFALPFTVACSADAPDHRYQEAICEYFATCAAAELDCLAPEAPSIDAACPTYDADAADRCIEALADLLDTCTPEAFEIPVACDSVCAET